jgi:threonyl-tRNA synthetase
VFSWQEGWYVVERDWTAWLNGLTWNPVNAAEFSTLPPVEQMRRIRHSSAHVMATALRRLDPQARFAVGPPTEHGFFYDVAPSKVLSTDDLRAIEAEMENVAKAKHPFEVAEIPKAEAVAYFAAQHQNYKTDILAKIPGETVTLYRDGDFIDLCAGPHVPHTGLCQHVSLLNVAGAHWRDEQKPSLTRISGTAWADGKSLRVYLQFIEEAKKRDHRVLGPQLDLFSFHPWAASALWHPHGVTVRQELLTMWRDFIGPAGYVEILNSLLYRKELFETSGHWDHFRQNMFIFLDSSGQPDYVLKPMNCPDTMLFFRSKTRSYRDLPMRVAEGQVLHRNEVPGALHGIMRTRNFVQDDAHIFLTMDQVRDEILALLKMLDEIYGVFKLTYDIAVSTRPESSLGNAEQWDQAEAALRAALEGAGREYVVEAGEGSFYGPKIDVFIRDSLGRRWQCGTIQLDFQLPERFELQYAAEDGTLKRPIVIHRALFGSIERFIAVLIEHLGGAFPTWLAPVQAAVLPVNSGVVAYAESVHARLREAGLRAELHVDESINYRIRQAETRKIPNMLVVGEREAQAGQVTLRRRGVKQQEVVGLDEMIQRLQSNIRQRVFDVELKVIEAPEETKAVVEASY